MNDFSTPSVFSLHDADPQPGLILDATGSVLEGNLASHHLCQNANLTSLFHLLPVNVQALVKSSLEQERSIENVEARIPADTTERFLVWTFVPDIGSSTVLHVGVEVPG